MEELQRVLSFQPSSIRGSHQPQSIMKLGYNTCYIVCGIVIKDDEVLMIQEAKPSCRGMWYMPAGRVERNESLEEAVKREVQEEAGYEFDPKALIAVEFQSFGWVRFTFVGDIVGGKLKTPAEEDKESIQAQWMTADTTKLKISQKLRAPDCLALIDEAYKWHKESQETKYGRLVVGAPHVTSSVKVILIRQDGDKIFVLLKDSDGLPHGDIDNGRDPLQLMIKVLNFAGFSGPHTLLGILSVEHQVQGGDGICITMVTFTTCTDLKGGTGYTWCHVTDPGMAKQLENYITKKNLLIELVDIWAKYYK